MVGVRHSSPALSGRAGVEGQDPVGADRVYYARVFAEIAVGSMPRVNAEH